MSKRGVIVLVTSGSGRLACTPGSRIGRGASEPHGKIQTLLDPKLYDGSAAKKIKIPNLPEKPKKAKKEPAA